MDSARGPPGASIDLRVISYTDDWVINPTTPLFDIPLSVIPSNPAFVAGPWELMLKHDYVLFDANGAHQSLAPAFASKPCGA